MLFTDEHCIVFRGSFLCVNAWKDCFNIELHYFNSSTQWLEIILTTLKERPSMQNQTQVKVWLRNPVLHSLEQHVHEWIIIRTHLPCLWQKLLDIFILRMNAFYLQVLLSAHPTDTHHHSGAVVFHQCNAERLIHPQGTNILAFSMIDALSPARWCYPSQACFVKADLSVFPLLIYSSLMFIGAAEVLSWFLLHITKDPVYHST